MRTGRAEGVGPLLSVGVRPAGLLSCLTVLLAGCTSDAARPDVAPPDAARPEAGSAPAAPERVRAVLDGVELRLEVADDEAERSVGLMRRTSVPPGTGMLFRYEQPSTGRFWMYDVLVPLRAVFVRDGRVVSSVVMPPCGSPQPADCPTYGADGPFDTVVETAPETLPDVRPGDVLVLER